MWQQVCFWKFSHLCDNFASVGSSPVLASITSDFFRVPDRRSNKPVVFFFFILEPDQNFLVGLSPLPYCGRWRVWNLRRFTRGPLDVSTVFVLGGHRRRRHTDRQTSSRVIRSSERCGFSGLHSAVCRSRANAAGRWRRRWSAQCNDGSLLFFFISIRWENSNYSLACMFSLRFSFVLPVTFCRPSPRFRSRVVVVVVVVRKNRIHNTLYHKTATGRHQSNRNDPGPVNGGHVQMQCRHAHSSASR